MGTSAEEIADELRAAEGDVVGICHCWTGAFVKDVAVDVCDDIRFGSISI